MRFNARRRICSCLKWLFCDGMNPNVHLKQNISENLGEFSKLARTLDLKKLEEILEEKELEEELRKILFYSAIFFSATMFPFHARNAR